MRLVAMVMVGPGEEDRYLGPFFEHLEAFCDEIRVRWESLDGVYAFDFGGPKIQVSRAAPSFFSHEGRARQELLMWTMAGDPSHILAIDADEFVADGAKLRGAMEVGSHTGVWKLTMTEIWGASEQSLDVRTDGKWPPRPVGVAFEVPRDHWTDRQKRRHWRLPDTVGGCGRVPILTAAAGNRTTAPPVTEILHFGWACKADRAARHARYANLDGFGHDHRHIASIMFDDTQVSVKTMLWPPSLDKRALLERVNRA